VYHKGYDIREPIEVRVLPDRIEILSHPGADRSISMEGLKNYRVSSRRYRNRRIGEFLKELHLTEGRNTGFQKIIRAMKANGSPMPIFETDEERTYFLTTFPVHPGFTGSSDPANDLVSDLEKEVELTASEKKVLFAIEQDAGANYGKIAAGLGISESTVKRSIQSLKKKGIICRDGSDKIGKWIILK
jgi:ATP-dependent DNA helicase RecG